MWVYYLYFFFLILFCIVLSKTTSIQLQHKSSPVLYLLLVILFMWIIIGCRDITVGSDTPDYVKDFRGMTYNKAIGSSSEVVFALVTYAIRSITDNYHVYFFLMSIIYCSGLYFLLKRYLHKSDEILIAICVLFLFGIYYLSVAAMRQIAAIGFTIYAFMSADKGRWKSFLLLVGIAFCLHNSSLITLLFYPLKRLNLKSFGILIVAGFFILSLVIPKDFMMMLQFAMDSDEIKYSQYGSSNEEGLSLSGFYLQLIPLIFVYLRRNKIPLKEETKNLFLNCAYLGAGFQALTPVVAEFFRVSIYFSIFDIVLIPLALSSLSKPYRVIGKGLFIAGCLVYLFVLSTENVMPIYK